MKRDGARRRDLVTRALTLALVAGLGGCRDTATFYVALGARGTLSTIYGPCALVDGTALRFSDERRYEAVASGPSRATCRDGDLLIEVRPAARIVINPVPSVRSGEPLFYGASLFDSRGNALVVGDDTALDWTFGGALSERQNPGCGDILPLCPSASTGFARASAPGVGTVSVAFGSLRATSTTRVTGP